MKSQHNSEPSQSSPLAPQEDAIKQLSETTLAEDEITDEALLEAIVGTGSCPAYSGGNQGDTGGGPASIGHRRAHIWHKHR